jgi:hypothetical protein
MEWQSIPRGVRFLDGNCSDSTQYYTDGHVLLKMEHIKAKYRAALRPINPLLLQVTLDGIKALLPSGPEWPMHLTGIVKSNTLGPVARFRSSYDGIVFGLRASLLRTAEMVCGPLELSRTAMYETIPPVVLRKPTGGLIGLIMPVQPGVMEREYESVEGAP